MNSKEINYELEKNMEVISQLDDFVGHAVDTVLVDPEDCWQPSDFFARLCQSRGDGRCQASPATSFRDS